MTNKGPTMYAFEEDQMMEWSDVCYCVPPPDRRSRRDRRGQQHFDEISVPLPATSS